MNSNPPAPLKIIIYYPATSPDPDRHQVEMRASQPLIASREGNHDDDIGAHHVRGKTPEGVDTDSASPGTIDYMHVPRSSEEDVEREVDGIGKQGTMDDPISISPIIAPMSFPTPPSPVIQAVEPLIRPRAKGPHPSKKRNRSPGAPGPGDNLTPPKKVRFLQAPDQPRSFQADDQTSIPKVLSQAGQPRFQATHQTFAPRGQCMHQLQAASSHHGRRKGVDVGVQDICVQSYCEGFSKVAPEIPPILIVSIDCVGFKVPFTVLQTASPLLFAASGRHGGVLRIPEPHGIIKFLLDCMIEKSVPIDVALATTVARGTSMTLFGVLIRLHNIAEEFGVHRAMRLIKYLLPKAACENPRAALGFALRDSPVDGQLAYQAISAFNPVIADACDAVHWTTIGRVRAESVGTSSQAASWAQSLHGRFMVSQKVIHAQGYHPTDAGYWGRVAAYFLEGIDGTWVGGETVQCLGA